MDKAEFIKIAPDYYLAAIVSNLVSLPDNKTFSVRSLVQAYTVEYRSYSVEYLKHIPLIEKALNLLLKADAISKVPDPFRYALYSKTDFFDTETEILKGNRSGPYHKSGLANDGGEWLQSALNNINDMYLHFGFGPADFENEQQDEWAPITIDQNEPLVREAIEKLEAATKAIEEDNGYPIKHPQERDAVVHDLKGGLEKFKSGTVSIPLIKRTVEALKIAAGRFANTARGQLIDGTLAAVKDFVKAHAGVALDYLWSLFT